MHAEGYGWGEEASKELVVGYDDKEVESPLVVLRVVSDTKMVSC